MARICALQATLLYLQTALAIQASKFGAGDYEALPWLAPLYQLYEYVRLAICQQTRILEDAELPDLDPLLAQLPLPIRTRLETAIKEELAGQVVHVSSEVAGLVREVVGPRRLRAGHSA